MKITSAGKNLLETATFIALDLGETSIEIGSGKECLTFILNFRKDDDNKRERIDVSSPNSKTLKIDFVNFYTPLGATTKEILEVGSFSNRKLFLAFHVNKTGSTGEFRVCTCSFYLGEEVPNGQN